MRKQILTALLICAGLLASCGGLRRVVYQPDPDCARRTLLKYTGVDAEDAAWTNVGSNIVVASKSRGLIVTPDPPYGECR